MVKQELIKRSPLRILEKSSHGGVQKGNVGVIAAEEGVGKTACLVHIATDQLLQGKHVIHVSFTGRTDHIISWYEDIFQEISRRRHLESAMNVHDEIIKNRIIVNFVQHQVPISHVIERIESLITQADFHADCVIIDGYNFHEGKKEEIDELRSFAGKAGLGIWFSAISHEPVRITGNDRVPTMLCDYLDFIDIVIVLEPREGVIHLELVKDHQDMHATDLHLKLDSKVLLITEE